MKRCLFLAAILLTMSMSVLAQYNNNRQNVGNRRNNIDNRRSELNRMSTQEKVDLMTKELDLTGDMTLKVLDLFDKHEVKRLEQVKANREQRGSGSSNGDVRRDEMWELRDKEVKQLNADLEKIIGKDKAEKWNEIRRDVRADNRDGRLRGRGDYNQRRGNNRRGFYNRRGCCPCCGY